MQQTVINPVNIKISRLPLYSRETCTFENFLKLNNPEGHPDGRNVKALADAKRLAAGEIPSLYLVGPSGVGKTHLGWAVCWQFLAQGKRVCYYPAAELLADLNAGYNRPVIPGEIDIKGHDTIMKFVMNVFFLMLDDLGVEKDTERAMADLNLIVNYRIVHQLPLLITSNDSKGRERIMDRMKMGEIASIEGPSWRGKNKT